MMKRILCLVIGIMFLFGGNGDCGVLTGGDYAVSAGPILLVGDNTEYTGAYFTLANRALAQPAYTAVSSGTSSKAYFRFSVAATLSWRIAIYDSSNNLLAVSDEGSSVSAGWNEITFSGANQISISSGTDYRLTVQANDRIDFYNSSSPLACNYQVVTYAAGAPDPLNASGSQSGTRPFAIYITT